MRTSLSFITLSLNQLCLYSSQYPYHRNLYPSTPQALCPFFFPFLCPSFSFLTTVTLFHYPVSYLIHFFLFRQSHSLLSLHSFISALLALMSVAMARSIQDGVFVLSAERKMNVAAMHHSPPVCVTVWVCVISVWCWHVCLFMAGHALI